jgi:transcriptional regulator GlxA family with amidase domain
MNTAWSEGVRSLLDDLRELRRNTGKSLAEWMMKKGSKNEENELVIELSLALAEADSLSRSIDSMVDGTGEKISVEELAEKFVVVKKKINTLIGRWRKFREQGIGF